MKTKTNNVMNEDLSALVAKAKTGDQAAFTELYDRTAPELYRCIRAMTRDEDLAWDIQQDSYLRAYRSLDTLESNDAFFPWLRRIAVNVTATQMGQRKALTFTEFACGEDDDATPELPDLNVENQPELSLDRKETARLVQQILSQLPEEMQLIVGMHYYDELSVKEISETLKVSAGTVKTQLFRGRKKIETAVHALEKQGVKLYGLSPVAFFVALMRRAEPAASASVKQAAVKAAVAKGTVDAVASAAVPVAAKTFGQVLTGRLLAGALAVTLIGGGIWGGARLLNSKQRDNPYQPTTVETNERMSGVETPEEISETGEALPVVTNPLVTNPAVTEPAATEPATTEAVTTEPTEPTADPDWPSGTCGKNLRWYLDPDGLLTIEGSGAMEDYDDTDNVPWREYREQITALSLPAGLTRIGEFAFDGCSALADVTIPTGVTGIGNGSFAACSALTSVKIPDSVTIIYDEAFSGCTALAAVTIPDGVEAIMDKAFYCTALTDVTIPDSVQHVGFKAFAECEALTSVTIGSGVRSFGIDVFKECGALSAIHVAADNSSYSSQDGVLFNKAKTELLIYPDGKADLSYTIPGSVTEISEDTFNNGVLTSVTIVGRTNVGRYTFKRCDALREIHAVADNPSYSSQDGVLFNKAKTELIQYPVGKTEAVYVIPDGITRIGIAAFAANDHLTGVTIPNSVTSIGEAAFGGCEVLTDITFPDSVTIIEDEAFDTCESLTSVTIPGSVTTIGQLAFEFCIGLTDVTICDGVAGIGYGAFYDCNALTDVTIPASVSSMEELVFEGCSEDLTIYGYAGTAAERYANENQIRFVAQ